MKINFSSAGTEKNRLDFFVKKSADILPAISKASRDKTVASDITIVSNMYKIVNFCPFSDARVSDGGAINASAGANIDKIFNDDFANLWDFDGVIFGGKIAVTIGTNRGKGFNAATLSDLSLSSNKNMSF